jgi:hypothetical protein
LRKISYNYTNREYPNFRSVNGGKNAHQSPAVGNCETGGNGLEDRWGKTAGIAKMERGGLELVHPAVLYRSLSKH